jgi:hypothetical protein
MEPWMVQLFLLQMVTSLERLDRNGLRPSRTFNQKWFRNYVFRNWVLDIKQKMSFNTDD